MFGEAQGQREKWVFTWKLEIDMYMPDYLTIIWKKNSNCLNLGWMHKRWKITFSTGGLGQSINPMTLPGTESLGLLKGLFLMRVFPLQRQGGKETKPCAVHGHP